MKKNSNQERRLDFIAKTLKNLSVNVARFLNGIGVTPNMITSLRLLIGAGSSYLFFLQGYVTDLLAIFFLGLFFFLDLVDGDLARKFKKTSKLGEFMDSFIDAVIINLVLLAIYGNLNAAANPFSYIPVIAIMGQGLSVLISQNYEAKFGISGLSLNPKIQSYRKNNDVDAISKFLFELLTPTNILTSLFSTLKYYLIVGALFNIIPLAITAYALMINLRWIMLSFTLALYYKYNQLVNKINFFYILKALERNRPLVI
ncbi:MAG: hypothetical protein A2687_01780 [Candidatus Levybacteria bacterium RIFCSPHIGHO2_01_FULL_38_26]|nr:MAG: hypothetical protein A2687_01780 [Candidatus Levybacteria bacterium RIFCSPHIGHO2_01_FULL_38_26]